MIRERLKNKAAIEARVDLAFSRDEAEPDDQAFGEALILSAALLNRKAAASFDALVRAWAAGREDESAEGEWTLTADAYAFVDDDEVTPHCFRSCLCKLRDYSGLIESRSVEGIVAWRPILACTLVWFARCFYEDSGDLEAAIRDARALTAELDEMAS